MVKCQVIMDAMEKIAPRSLAEDWDNPGLLAGSPAQEVNRVLVCLDVSEAIIDRAIAEGYDMILSHHPLIFHSMKQVRTDLPLGRMLQKLLAHGIAVFAAHTNLDIAAGGVNDVLAERIGLRELQPFAITQTGELVKLAVYVPAAQAAAVREAITQAGAGFIGNYSSCTFNVSGKGTFLPQAETHPFIGQPGRLDTVDEVRIETILPAKLQARIVRAMRKAHPYEEPAYDLYPLKNPGEIMSLGRVGFLPAPLPVEAFAQQVRQGLAASHVRLVRAGSRPVRKVALCSGSGAEFIAKAAYMGADAYVTGDVKYHDAQQAAALGMHVIDAGHFPTEFPVVGVLAERLRASLKAARGGVEITADDTACDFFEVVE